jgi:8-amino-7-oxononanoate synthase
LNEEFLLKKLNERKEQNAFRQLRLPEGKTDFCSNDYLGFVHNSLLEKTPASLLWRREQGSAHPALHGSGGSRLLAGNYALIEETERSLAAFHEAEAGLIFNSGYDANLGLLSCVPLRGDTVLYDALSHASIRDGIRLSFAQSFPFLHNDSQDLEKKLQTAQGNCFVVTESVFSMDGDQAPLQEIARLCALYGAHLVVDEAHATGVVGPKGEGLVQEKGLQGACFARIHTFGKALGCHGAIVLGSEPLRDYLINFSRAFIYTTALPETSVLAIQASYALFPHCHNERERLHHLVGHFREASFRLEKINSHTPIQAVIVPGNEAVKKLAAQLQSAGLDIRPILYPTVPRGSERLRIVLHAFNTTEELDRLVAGLSHVNK